MLFKGSDVRPGIAGSPQLCRCDLRGARYLVLSKGSDVRPGVAWPPQLRRYDLRGACCSPRGRMYASGSQLCPVATALPLRFAWQARYLVVSKGSDVRPGVAWSQLCRCDLRGRRGILCALQGVGCTPGVAWSPQLCRCDLRGRRGTWCSPRGRMYALGAAWSLQL